MTLAVAPHLDTELITRIRAGDEEAFAQLFQRYYRELCIFAARIARTEGTPEEIVQEVFFRIWMHRDRLMLVQTLSSYLYTSVRNQALNQAARLQSEQKWRQSAWSALQETPAEAAPADEEIRATEIASAIDRAIAQLAPRCRQTFLLRRQQHLSYAEIAEIMQISPKTVEVQIGNALKQLRKSLAEWM
jgi:RNA polymerase sigma-70 factor, ECF subfamily